jgi:hypothetical protein
MPLQILGSRGENFIQTYQISFGFFQFSLEFLMHLLSLIVTRSARETCVDRMIFFGEKSLRHAMLEGERSYNHEHPHQGLENKIIKPDFDDPMLEGDIESRSRLC